MFPIMPSVAIDDRHHDLQLATRRESKSASRMDAQRHLLEQKKMYHLNSMIVDQRALDRDRDLARRQMLAEAQGQGPNVSMTSKIRQSFGGALISIGERIRPEFVKSEPKFNG